MALYWSFLLPSFVCLAFTCFNQCFLKPLLIQVALAASRSEKHPEIYGKKQALQKRHGKKKAIIAIARRLLTAIYHILSKGEAYDPSAYRTEDKPPVVRLISQEKALEMLARMGFIVSDSPPPAVTGVADLLFF